MEKKFVTIGAALWDVFDNKKNIGGSALNVALSLSDFECETYLVTAVGKDDAGKEIFDVLSKKKVNTNYIQVKRDKDTGKNVIGKNENGQLINDYVIDVAYDYINFDTGLVRLSRECDVVVFGTFAQRNSKSCDAIFSFADNVKGIRVYDVNLNGWYEDTLRVVINSLKIANMLKLNDNELRIISRKLGLHSNNVIEQLKELRFLYGLKLIALTRGVNGNIILSKEGFYENPGHDLVKSAIDGVEDAFTAAFVFKSMQTKNLKEISEFAENFVFGVFKK